MKRSALILLVAFIGTFFVQNAKAQISEGGTPPSFVNTSNISSDFDIKTVDPIDVVQALQEDNNRPGPEWAGRSIPVSYDMNNSGTWTDLPDGRKIWRLQITSTGAQALGLCYNNFYLPEGGQLFIYNASENQIRGAYTFKNNPADKLFATELIQGESLTLEYVSPSTVLKKTDPNKVINATQNGNKISSGNNQLSNLPIISISEVVYVYKTIPFLKQYNMTKQTGWGASLACEVNINCSEGTNWQIQKRGVAEIWLKMGTSWGWCTGDLVNTTNNSGIPYFLTADHCHSEGGTTASAADMLQWGFYFNYEGTACADPATEPTYNTITGCTLKASSPINGGSDFCLVLLNSAPTISFKPYYNGWNHNNTAPTSGVGIHHPAGDIKKISTYTATLGTGTWNDGTNVGTTNAHWSGNWVATTNGYGQVEGGSSGSPLFNQNNLQVGTLTGGSAASCTTGSSFEYGKFYFHWDQDGTASTVRLRPWLDPLGTNPATINGYDPFAGYPDFYGTPTTLYEGQSANFFDLTTNATTWAWSFEGGSPSTSTIKNPTNIVYNQQGTYRVTLTTNTAVAGTQSIEKVGYITVLPGVLPTSIWCDDFTTPANWTLSTSGGYTDNWAITTAAPTGTYSSTMGRISSTSGGNYALFDSDALGAASDNQWANISSATGQNCSTYESVFLRFQENYMKFYDSTLVYVSTDNFVTSKRYVLHSDFANNGATTNPYVQNIDISSVAAGKTNVKVRFTFRSTQNMSTNAGWGYAWEIDDVCLLGVAYGNTLPTADFTATTSRDISPGESVSFADLSTHATSWLWTFEGGTPATSTVQNPTNIVYTSQGYYKVTLAASNQNGTITAVKTDYIHVYSDCSYDGANIQDDDQLSYSLAPTGNWGYVPGHNYNGGVTSYAYADRYTIGNLTGKVKSLDVGVALASVVGAATNVTFTIWSDNAGTPGTVLMTKAVAVSSLQPGYINTIEFSPVSVSNSFFAGFQLTNVAALDTFACYIAKAGVNRINTAYCYNGSTWQTYLAKYGVNASLYILPEFCLDKPNTYPPDVDFYASQTEITPGTSINFFDQSTGGPVPTSWAWSFSGATPTTATTQNPATENYAAAGLYDVSLTAANSNGSNAKTKGGYILVSPVSNIVYWNFPSTSANLTADGGITANLAKTLTVTTSVSTPVYATTGAGGGTDKCASSFGWNDAITTNDYWSVEFTTAGYTNIKLSSKQSGTTTAAPKYFSVYYSIDGGNNFSFLTDVPAMTTASNWTQGVLNNFPLPSECDNQASVMILWLKTATTSMAGGTITSAALTLIDDIYVSGQVCPYSPAAAGTITGTSTICQGQTNVVYTIPAITGATVYNWTVPTGATIVSGQYTNTITVNYAQNQVAGNINVYGENICGTGTVSASFPITVNPVPVSPGTITGIQAVTGGQNGVSYSVGAVTGATSYTWTMPGFATIASGGTTNSITANFACPGDNGNMTVHANNACGSGPESYAKTINITCAPVADFYASTQQICAGSTVTFTDISTNSPTGWSWTFTGGAPATSTLEHPTVTYNTAGTYAVTLIATNATGNNTITKTAYISVTSGAASVSIAASSNPVCSGSGETFTATPTNGGTPSYQWKVGGVNVGTNSPYYYNSSLPTGSVVTCVMTSTLSCATGSPATSNTLTMTVNPVLVPLVSIAVTTGSNPSCAGSSVTFTATPTNGGTTPSYQWTVDGVNAGTNSTTFTPSSLTTGQVVRCILTSNATCVNPATSTSLGTTITVNPVPVVTPAASLSTICGGSASSLSASSTVTGTTYAWMPGSLSGTPVSVTPSSTTTYTLTGTASGCTGSSTVTISVNPKPVVTPAASYTTICNGTASSLSASSTVGGTTYGWTPGSLSGTPVSVTPSTTTTYTLTGTASGCTGTATIAVTVNPNPVVTPAATLSTICNGTASSLSASSTVAGTNYTWMPGSLSGTPVSVTPASTTTYTLTGTASGCTGTSTIAITVNPKPVVTPSATLSTICNGTSSSLSASSTVGGTNYTWMPGSLSGTPVSVTPSSTTTYTLSGTASGCTGTSTIAITVNPKPVVTPSATLSTICNGSSSSLSASSTVGGTTYGWMPGSLGGTPVSVTPSSTTTYTLTGTASGCTGTATIAVTVNPIPTVNNPGNITVCNNGTVSSTSFVSTPVGGTFAWSNSNTAIGLAASGSGNISGFTATNTGVVPITATITVTPTLSNCSGTPITYTITVNPTDNSSFNYSPSTLCQTGSDILATIPGGATGTFTSSPSGLIFLNTSTGQIDVSASAINAYTITFTTNGTCPGSSISSITITTSPLATFNYTGPYCSAGIDPMPTYNTGSSAGTFSASPTGLAFISTTTGQVDVSVSTPGSYTVTNSIAASGGCSAVSATSSITINATPDVTVPTNIAVCGGSSISGTAFTSSVTGTNYSWSNSNTSIGLAASGTGNIPGFTAVNTATSPITATITVTPSTTSCTGTPSTYTITVTPLVTPTVSIVLTSGTNPMCSGSSATFTATPGNEGTTPAYQWQVNTVNAGSDSPIFTTSTLSTGQIVTCILTSNALCVSSTTATSTGIGMTVDPPITVSANATPTLICAGSSSTIAASGALSYAWEPGTLSGISQVVSPSSTSVYTVTGTSLTCTDTATVTVSVDPCTGIASENDLNNFTIGPIPVDNELIIDCKKPVDIEVSVYSIEGKLLSQSVFSGGQTYSVPMLDLATGVYMIRIISENNSKIFKIIKQ